METSQSPTPTRLEDGSTGAEAESGGNYWCFKAESWNFKVTHAVPRLSCWSALRLSMRCTPLKHPFIATRVAHVSTLTARPW